jgi:hypothetical protein
VTMLGLVEPTAGAAGATLGRSGIRHLCRACGTVSVDPSSLSMPTPVATTREPMNSSAPRRSIATILAILVMVLALPVAASAADRDGDGLTDDFETHWGLTDPDHRDTDRDGVIDASEDLDGDGLGNRGEQRAGTDPGRVDTDGDELSDSLEDHDGDGRTNAQEQDQRKVPANLKPSLKTAHKNFPWAKGKWCAPSRKGSQLVRCHFGDRSSDTTVVLMGDSHAIAWIEAAWRTAEAHDWHLITLLKSACVPLKGVYTFAMHNVDRGKPCRAWRQDALEWVGKRGSKIDALIIGHSDSYTLAKTNGQRIAAADALLVWSSGLRRTLKAIPEPIEVILLADLPRNERNPVRCLKFHPRDMSSCTSARESAASRTVEQALRKVAEQEGEHHRSLSGQICPYDPCPVVQGNTLIWRDRTHLTGTFTRRLTPSFRQMVAEVIHGSR